ncbi:hypothetical protein FACS1894158_18240 [Betaproteobacteria bacterium]|nr:hypothetical protein FACS1894158_18240 [Betaproteobacteria bacterium]
MFGKARDAMQITFDDVTVKCRQAVRRNNLRMIHETQAGIISAQPFGFLRVGNDEYTAYPGSVRDCYQITLTIK